MSRLIDENGSSSSTNKEEHARSRLVEPRDLPLMFDVEQDSADLFRNLYIFEMANNHQGDLSHGLRIIREMGKVARLFSIRACVKLQYRNLDTFIHVAFRERTDIKHIPRFLGTRLSDEQFRTLIEAMRDEGLISMVTPFDEASVDQCVNHGVEILKVASCSATDWPLLEAVAQTGRPVVVSTGGVDFREIDSIVSFLTHKGCRFALMHCVALYPTPSHAAQLHLLDRLRSRYPGIPVGYSGHESPDNLDVVKVAAAKGAALLERHVGIPTDTYTMNAYSMNPEQTQAWVAAALESQAVCGTPGRKIVSQQEAQSIRSLQRGVYARRRIRACEPLAPDDVFFAMPCLDGQVTSGAFGRYRATYVASREYQPGDAIFENARPDQISLVREIVHDVKGMLHEAHIAVAPDFEIELSHHCGLQEFRRTGAVIITMVNRTYCKKLVIVLPGQAHPSHFHRVKEETFQLLWGDLEMTIASQVRYMQRGETVLVRPGQTHSFRSRGGAIFEEISTHHHRGDSVYEDPAIHQRDALERKTILRNW
jgi:N-acetylneuraminate synthase